MSKDFVLYGTSACHLCEVAEGMLHEALAQVSDIQMRKEDISESDELFERYGLMIPVLADSGGRELRWPFDRAELAKFLSA